MAKAYNNNLNIRWLEAGLWVLLAVLPFHAFLTTWAGHLFGYREVWQAWKEVLAFLLSILAIAQIGRDKPLRVWLWKYLPNKFIVIYGGLHLLLAAFSKIEPGATLLGLRTNLIFLVVFILAQTAGYYLKPAAYYARLKRLILWPAAAVAAFGALQGLLLSREFLTNFGYGPHTIEPYLLIQDSNIVRILSTFDSPNTLAAYLILPLTLAIGLLIKKQLWRWWWAFAAAGILALYFSHSRSGWGAMIAALVFLAWWLLPKQAIKKYAAWTVLIAVLLIGISIWFLPKISTLQSVLLHSPIEKAATLSSNDDHLELFIKGVGEAAKTPLGRGPGTAGPASFASSEPLVTENYFLQIAVEAGVIGLGLFIAVNYLVIKTLWLAKKDILALALIASFIGLTLMSLLLHTWANPPTAIIWWGIAGIMAAWVRLKLSLEHRANIARSRS